jgi:uncharacterized protein (UPF0212 family)
MLTKVLGGPSRPTVQKFLASEEEKLVKTRCGKTTWVFCATGTVCVHWNLLFDMIVLPSQHAEYARVVAEHAVRKSTTDLHLNRKEIPSQ